MTRKPQACHVAQLLDGCGDHREDADWRLNDEKVLCQSRACYRGLCVVCAAVVVREPLGSLYPYRLWCWQHAEEARDDES